MHCRKVRWNLTYSADRDDYEEQGVVEGPLVGWFLDIVVVVVVVLRVHQGRSRGVIAKDVDGLNRGDSMDEEGLAAVLGQPIQKLEVFFRKSVGVVLLQQFCNIQCLVSR